MKWRPAILAAGLAISHLVVSFAIFAVLYGAGMHRFDHGGEPAAWEHPAKAVLFVLAQPAYSILVLFPTLRTGALVETLLFLFNSLLWGLAAACVFEWLASFRRRGRR